MIKCRILRITEIFLNSFEPSDHEKSLKVQEFVDEKLKWSLTRCNELKKNSSKFSKSQTRIFNILCRGGKYTKSQQR